MIMVDKNHEIWPRESPADKLGLSEICTHFYSPKKKFWRFLQTVKMKNYRLQTILTVKIRYSDGESNHLLKNLHAT